MSLIYRGNGWNVQDAVARGARLAQGKGGDLLYTSDELATLDITWKHFDTDVASRPSTSVPTQRD